MKMYIDIYISRTSVRVGGFEVPASRIGFIRTMIISYAKVLVQVLKKGKSLNSRKKTNKHVLHKQCFKVPGTTDFKKKIF